MKFHCRVGILALGLILGTACSAPPAPSEEASPAAHSGQVNTPNDPASAGDPSAEKSSSADVWWGHLSALCGKAFAGRLISDDPADSELAGQAMTMHVRRCEDHRLEIPFHIGENRSRTWVLTRTDGGIQLQHDHRHEDGSEDAVTLYGGRTADAGTESAQNFPADEYSKELFGTHGLDVSKANIWTMEIIPGERFSYILRRPERHFQADFDLTQTVPQPPAPWGHE